MAQTNLSQEEQDKALLQKLGYKQELQRTLGFRLMRPVSC